MYLHKVKIQNIRSIKNFELRFNQKEYAGWHVIIGDNGAGKSTLVRAIALGLVGPTEVKFWADWLRYETRDGTIDLQIDHDPKFDKITKRRRTTSPLDSLMSVQLHINDLGLSHDLSKNQFWNKTDKGTGWFSASYGPFRRFTGGNKEYEKLFSSNPRLAPHLSAFSEEVALTDSIEWLQALRFKQLEKRPEGKLVDDLKTFLNQGELLPPGTFLEEVTSDAVVFRDGNGCKVAVEQLSDGYRSILSMTFELIWQMVLTYGPNQVFQKNPEGRMIIDLPGIVLIDEIDAHLHPTWQRRIGLWFCRHFPKLQFIVTTHSPLICQAAERGSVWRLPAPGSDEKGGRVKGIELQRLIYGSILEALDTNLFGQAVTRSESSKRMLQRLAELNIKSLSARLNAKERKEQQELQTILPITFGLTKTGEHH
jgi:energy-coupling factor transporter ATP-binding protein EcfA2